MQEALIFNLIALWIFMFVNLFLSLAIIRRLNEQHDPQITPHSKNILLKGETFPPLSVKASINNSLDSYHQTKSGDDSDREEIFVFISSKCDHCRNVLKELNELYPFEQKDMVTPRVVSIDDLEATGSFIADMDLQIPVYITDKLGGQMLLEYKISGTPFFYHVKNGVVHSGGFFDDYREHLIRPGYSSESNFR